MAEVVTTQLLDPGLVDACGPQPGLTCEWIWDATASGSLAALADWLIERPLKVAVILIGAVVVNRLVKRAIDRLVSSLVESRTREEGEAEAESSTRLAQLGRRARGRLQNTCYTVTGGSCLLRRGGASSRVCWSRCPVIYASV